MKCDNKYPRVCVHACTSQGDPKQIERALHCAWNKLNKTRREPHIKKAQIENETNIIAYNEAKKKYDAEMAKMKSSGNASSANLKTSMDMVIANKVCLKACIFCPAEFVSFKLGLNTRGKFIGKRRLRFNNKSDSRSRC